MEYRNKVVTLSSVLAALCVTAVLGIVFNQGAVSQRETEQPLLSGYDAAAATRVELANGVVLEKTAAWGLSAGGKTYPAAAERIDTYLKSLALLKRDRLASSGADAQPYGLDQGFKMLKVLGTGGKVLADLQVGSVNDQGKVYVRLNGSKDIWETDASFARSLTLDFNTWANLALFAKKTPTRIAFNGHIQTADKTVYGPFDLVRSEGKDGKAAWQNRLTKAAVDLGGWADNFVLFRFNAFATAADPAPDAPLGVVTVEWSDGSKTAISLGKPDKQNRYRANDGTKDFWINDWALGQLLYK
jgi:hypothetical protein